MGTIVDELVTLLSLQSNSSNKSTADSFSKSLQNIQGLALKAAGTVTAAASAIGYFMEKSTHSSAALYSFHNMTGMSTKSIQQWSHAAKMAGGSAEGMKADLESLLTSMNPVMPGEFNQGMFMLFKGNVSGLRDADTILGALAEKFKVMSAPEAMNWSDKIGISRETGRMLRVYGNDLEKLKKMLPGMAMQSEKAAKAGFEFQQKWENLKATFVGVATTFGTMLTPKLTELLVKFQAWISTSGNQKIILSAMNDIIKGVSEGIDKWGNSLGGLKDKFKDVYPALAQFAKVLTNKDFVSGAVKGGLLVLLGILGMMAGKAILVGMAFAGAVMAIEDLYKLIQGAPSFMGTLVDKAMERQPDEKISGKKLHPGTRWLRDAFQWNESEKPKKESEKIGAPSTGLQLFNSAEKMLELLKNTNESEKSFFGTPSGAPGKLNLVPLPIPPPPAKLSYTTPREAKLSSIADPTTPREAKLSYTTPREAKLSYTTPREAKLSSIADPTTPWEAKLSYSLPAGRGGNQGSVASVNHNITLNPVIHVNNPRDIGPSVDALFSSVYRNGGSLSAAG